MSNYNSKSLVPYRKIVFCIKSIHINKLCGENCVTDQVRQAGVAFHNSSVLLSRLTFIQIIHETEFLVFDRNVGLLSPRHCLIHYYLCKCNKYKNKLSYSTTCFNLYKSS